MAEERAMPADGPAPYPTGLQISRQACSRFGLSPELGDPGRDLFWNLQLLSGRLAAAGATPVPDATDLYLLATLGDIQRHLLLAAFAAASPQLSEAQRELPGMFLSLFPPAESRTRSLTGRRRVLRGLAEVVVHLLHDANPAVHGPLQLLRESTFTVQHAPRTRLATLELFQPPGPEGPSLFEHLSAPHRAAPDSLAGQLAYIRRHWEADLPEHLRQRLLHTLASWEEHHRGRAGGPGPVVSPGLGAAHEPEAFSSDAGWMERLVLIAKSTLVWLDQLSTRYGREIRRIDEIPDAELDELAGWGVSGLWLIGLWERSESSRRIKRQRGNPEAEASAYALYDYRIAAELGGEEALERLATRCRQRGIRLACDVVANHSGLHSRWTREHPEWFMQVDTPPFPGYTFNGPDLSPSEDIALFLEDGYWDHRDAAVVFKHLDRRTGRVRYLYHGNDGTHLPWNDTAQLDFLNPEVRDMMVETIVGIARRFPIIRFDAAMTLAKRHFQRLWYPLPGSGGGVPSRANHALSAGSFEQAFPVEFWREVVDRVAAEVPDCLLLAEAFWLMEGYFVRSLGMHRVYNSAFMNMLRDEQNGRFLAMLRETMDFNAAILQRFVNFMSNPDEATAIEQFGHGDKYFAVAVLLATLPGLPMLGHGQCEGLREKYGMEYRRAYWHENRDEGLLAHHRAQIFPLLQRRPLFSGADEFTLFPLEGEHGVDDHVIAFSNRRGPECALVVVHNRHAHVRGRLHHGTAGKRGGGLTTRSLGEALGVSAHPETLYRLRSFRDGREILLRGATLDREGLVLELGPYGYEVFLGLTEQPDPDGRWGMLCERLRGRPVASLEREFERLQLPEFHQLLHTALRAEPGDRLEAARRCYRFAADLLAVPRPRAAEGRLREHLLALERMKRLSARSRSAGELLVRLADPAPETRSLLGSWLILDGLQALESASSPSLFRRLELGEALAGFPQGELASLLCHLSESGLLTTERLPLARLLADGRAAAFLQLQTADGHPRLNAGRLEALLEGLTLAASLQAARLYGPASRPLLARLGALERRRVQLLSRAVRAGYRLDRLLRLDAT